MAFLSLCEGNEGVRAARDTQHGWEGKQHCHNPEYDSDKYCPVWQHGLGKVPANAQGGKQSFACEWRTLLKSLKGEGNDNLLKENSWGPNWGLREKKNIEEVRKVLLVFGNEPAQCCVTSPQVNYQSKRAIGSWEAWSGLPAHGSP